MSSVRVAPGSLRNIDPGHAHAKPLKLDDAILKARSYLAGALHGTVHAVHAYTQLGTFPYTTVPLGVTTDIDAQAKLEARRRLDTALANSSIPARIGTS